ncbi:MAG: hypothetical protein ACYDHZ_05540 [Dehalococcoidia bacterium]
MSQLNKLTTAVIAVLAITVISISCAGAGAPISSEGGVEVYNGVQPPYLRTKIVDAGDVGNVHLVTNPVAKNPTWQQLKDFIKQDKTDDDTYNTVVNPCGAFAETVYNNAEASGIRAAFVAITLGDSNMGHACNAFETTDMGMAYVDCTGMTIQESLSGSDQHLSPDGKQARIFGQATSHDKIAYVAVGQELGFISMEVADSPEYSYYEQYKARFNIFKNDLEACNAAIVQYNSYADQYNRSRSSSLMTSVNAQKYLVNKLTAQVNSDAAGLGAFWPEMGVVQGVKIYW